MTEKIFSKKWIFILMAILLVLFLKEDKIILNVPLILNICVFVISLLIILIFQYKHNSVKKKKKNNNTIINIVGVFILSFFIFIILKLSINFCIIKSSEKMVNEEIKLPIDNFISGRTDLIYFNFNDKRYSLRYNNTDNLSREEIVNKHILHIIYSKSFFEIYVIKKYNIEFK
ncbi:hypothetical protein MW871_07895 [Flavobacterium sp. I-SCBP12n]|uniref:Uncharacterized protein n=1 Tax=Flavobacterium pygoscelis TaxID=2893176 RepID=A0A9X1XQR7_9FLAO|nr:hypothetical protein [Flavobacterium pygoscelis]MCK8141815.1 hypothetical protein [Flavobacterium pygoscelis]